MHTVTVENRTRPLPQPIQAKYCDDFRSRLRGLMFRHQIDRSEGLVLVQSRDSRMDASIHMFFVYIDLAVVWIDSANQVVDTCIARSWRPAYAPRRPARFILEIHPDRLGEFTVGDRVQFIDG